MRLWTPLNFALLCSFALSDYAAAQASPAVAAKTAPAKPAATPAPGEAHYQALSAHHKNVEEHAKALHHHAGTHATIDKDVAKEHAEEMGKSLSAAKRHHAAIEQAAPADAKTKPHHDAITAHHASATEHHTALKTELEKSAPDAQAVKEHAAAVHKEIKAAEAANKQLKAAKNVKEPVEPAAK